MIKQLYIIHGYGASPEEHWFPWLKKQFENKGWNVSVLKMPDPENPEVNEWVGMLDKNVKELNEHTYFAAHSLGTATLLKYLTQYEKLPEFGGFVLVSAFDRKILKYEALSPFVEEKTDYEKINSKAMKRIVIASENDTIVPIELSREVAEKLKGEFYTVENGGHFLGREGFTELPLVEEVLQ
ncbi:MAG: alpha/beta hydrolase [Leptotrichiaceae bacterium]|nr:alpha/beta hydrolase [Leptotrichiaceae bacterium]